MGPNNLQQALDAIDSSDIDADILDLAPEFGIDDDNDWHLMRQASESGEFLEPIEIYNDDFVIGIRW